MPDLNKGVLHPLAVPATRTAALPAAGAPRFPTDQRANGGLAEILRLLARQKTRLLIGASLGLLAAFVIFLLSPSRYQARVVLQIQNPNADFLNARSVNSVAEASAADSGSLTDVATEIKIIESDQLLDRVITKLRANGQGGPLAANAPQSRLARILHRKTPAGDAVIYRLREQERPNISVKQIGPTRAVEIAYTSTDPVFAAEFANMMAQQYIDMSEEARWSKSRRTGDSLSRELDDVRARLKVSQNALQKYAASSGLLFVNGQHPATDSGDISENKLGQLQSALSQAHSDRVSAQSHYEVARSADPEDVSDVLNDQRLRELKEKLTDLKRQRAELATIYTDENDKVRRVVAQIDPLEAEFHKQRKSILNRIEQDFRTAQRRERLLQQSYSDQVHVVEGKEGDSIQYSILKQDVDSNQRLYDSVLEQIKRAGIASAVRSNNIEIFDPAKPPVAPYSPRPLLLSVLGIFGGLLATSLFTVLTESPDRKLQVPGELQGRLQLRELAVIPANQTVKLLGADKEKSKTGIELISASRRRGIADEAYRTLLTSILYSDQDGQAPRTIVVTSANPGEGKTTTTCNLGILMTELNQRVLLIDADLCRPRLHQIFATFPQRGLSELLGDEQEHNAQALIQRTYVSNLFLLPSGTSRWSPTKLLHSPRLFALLQQLRRSFDVILIDTSPSLLTVDSRILGRNADAVVLVTRAGFTTCSEVEMIANRFAADGTRVLGTVLNDVRVSQSKYNYYYAESA
jgi:capsular exopolysaccharide synthesis family protein